MISLIMPVKNQEKHIVEAIESIINQSYRHYELIIIDNQSNDRSLDIIQNYQKKDSRIKLYQSDGLAGKSRNLGLSKARGDSICFVDADDFFDNNMLSLLNDSMIQTKSDVIVSKAYRFNNVNKATRIMNYLSCPPSNLWGVPLSPVKDLAHVLFQTTIPCPWAKLFSRQLIEKCDIRFQDLHNANDILFVYGCICNAASITFISDSTMYYRTHFKSLCQGNKDAYPIECVKAYESLYRYLIKLDKLRYFEKSFIKLVHDGLIWNLNSLILQESKDILKKTYYDSELYKALKNIKGDNYDCFI